MSNDLCELLPWDSTFFGLTIARARAQALTPDSADAIDAWCRDHRVDCLYFVARPDDAATVCLAESRAYHLADLRTTLEFQLTDLKSERSDLRLQAPRSVRPAHAADVPALRAIAHVSHTDTRFFFDPRFPRDDCHRLYETWIESSLNGYAQAVLVGTAAGGPELTGYVTCHLRPGSDAGSIGLLAVSPDHQGRGVGKSLVAAALHWLASHGARRASVVTQGRNAPALRLYARCGFIPAAVQLYYHRWFT